MFIVIDGIDGSGKGTQVQKLVEKLQKLWKKVKLLDYPRYWQASAFAVEKYLNWGYGDSVSAKQSSIFYALDRYDDSFNFKKDLEEYDYIISNRYVSASMIHQWGKISDSQKRDEFLHWLYDLEFNIFSIPKPDKTIFLSVTPDMSQKLVLEKESRDYIAGKKMDIHEADKDHLKNAWETAQILTDRYDDWYKIECQNSDQTMRSINEIHEELMELIGV